MSESATINNACDVFSYGMVLYELLAHQLPFPHIEDPLRAAQMVLDHKRPDIPPSLPHYLEHLMQACWEHDPHDRPDFQAIVHAQESKNFTHETKPHETSESPQGLQPSPVVRLHYSQYCAHLQSYIILPFLSTKVK